MKKLRLYATTMWRLIATVQNWPLYLLNKWQLTTGDRVRYRLRNGTVLIARPYAIEGGALNDVWLDRSYEPNDKGIVFDWTQCKHIIDIGANIGTFMLYAAAKAPSAHIYTFEPEPSNYVLVQENIQANRLEQRVHAFNAGVAATTGSLTLYVTGDTGGHSVFDYSHAGTPTTVPCFSLERVFTDNSLPFCDFLKIDCEGAEYDILYALSPDYYQKISFIALEYHHFSKNPLHTPAALQQHLEKQGFTVSKPKKSLFFAHRTTR